MRILLVEDEPTLSDAVRTHVTRHNHAVDLAEDKESALACLAGVDYALVLLDLRLPDGSGLDILKHIRLKKHTTPVIILTAHDQVSDRIAGLNAGADDYLVKPFDLDELEARIHAVTRRYGANQTPMVELAGFEIYLSEHRIESSSGERISLSAREWAVLECLLLRRNSIVSKSQIEEALYAFGAEIESNTVEVYVSRLRRKLGKEVVETIRGIGYRVCE